MVVGEPFETSDHQMIRFELIGRRLIDLNSDTNFNYFRANYTEIRKHVAEQNLNLLIRDQDVNNCWMSVKSELLLLRNKFVPQF